MNKYFDDVIEEAIEKSEATMKKIEEIRPKKPSLSQRIAVFLTGIKL